MRRIAIVGCGGAGKSTLARRLGEILKLEVVHLDAVLWRPGWIMTPKDEELKIQSEIAGREAWIIDGNYGGTMELRFARADTIIFLDFPRTTCLWRVLKRRIRYAGTTRPDMAPGCNEQVDWEFLRWIWNFPRVTKPKIMELLQRHQDKRIAILGSVKDVRCFLEEVQRAGPVQ